MYQRHKRIAAVLLAVTVLAGIGLHASRNYFLQRVADRRMAGIEQRHGVRLHCQALELKGVSTVCLRGLTVVPQGCDTLLTIRHLELRLSPWRLLTGQLQVKEIILDGLHLNLQKKGTEANYDFLFRQSPHEKTPDTTTQGSNYAHRVHTLLDWLFGRVPDNGRMADIRVTERHNAHTIVALMPELQVTDNHFHTRLEVAEDTLDIQQWTLRGNLSPAKRKLAVELYAEDKRRIRLPYLERRIGADVQFDTLTCRLTETEGGDRHTRLDGQTRIAGLQLFHTALSTDTIMLDKGALDYVLNIGPQTVELDSASTVHFNRLSFHPYLRLRHTPADSLPPPARWHVTASLDQPWFPAQELFESLPKGLFDVLEGIETEGRLAYHGLLDVDFACPDSLKLESELRRQDFRIVRYGTTDLGKMSDEFEYTAYEDGRPVRTFPIGPSWEHFTSLADISPLLQMAVMQSEDGAFFYHHGFLVDALREALIQDLKEHRFARGGSTISMQLVKNVFLNRKKNITRKLEEALIVWLIENQGLTSKERMYEVYMNIIEWGPLVYGAGEASRFYFDKRPSQLTVEEAIFLASIVPKPKHFRNSFDKNGHLRESLAGYYRLIAGRLAKKGLITEEEAAAIRPTIEIKGEARKLLEIKNEKRRMKNEQP